MNVPAIYKIENLVNNKFYIGSSRNSGSRKNGHFSALRIGNHGNYKLQRDFNEYGEDSFRWSIIEIVETSNSSILTQREQYWIDTLHPHYNIRKDAQNLNWEYISEESRKSVSEHMRKRQTGRKQSQAEKDRRAESIKAYWKTHPAKTIPKEMREHLSKINTGKSNPNWGKKRTPEQLKRQSEGRANIVYTFKSPKGNTVSFRRITNSPTPLSYSTLRKLVRGILKESMGWTFVKKEHHCKTIE